MALSEINRHNITLLKELEEGDLVEFPREFYSHWGVFIGGRKVVHLAGDDNDGLNNNITSGNFFTISGVSFNKAVVKISDFFSVADTSKAQKNNSKDSKLTPSDRKTITERALSKVGEIGYNVLWKNCEHFASWCRYGVEWSEQADSFIKWTAITAVVVGVGAMAIFSESKEKKEKEQESMYCIKSRQSSRGEQESDEEEK